MNWKIAVVARNISGVTGYDVLIRNEGASVRDYLNAINMAITTLPLQRTRRRARHCRACDHCCAERAPLTAIDCLLLKKVLEEPDLNTFINRHTTVTVKGPVVDITLKQDDEGRCIFLNHKKKTCRVYEARPFVCQTFICSPASRRALELREEVVNKGEDELVRLWFKTNMVVHQAHNPRPNPVDWPPTPFTNKSCYSSILLKDVLSPGLWQKLTRPEKT
ncbi:MAG: YkgJ family cysteine cluster protein [Peptococcaceae bacterium]|nr:MAG: YkgJ family cysteine cluster protein [Peptococcaceae bacterium]